MPNETCSSIKFLRFLEQTPNLKPCDPCVYYTLYNHVLVALHDLGPVFLSLRGPVAWPRVLYLFYQALIMLHTALHVFHGFLTECSKEEKFFNLIQEETFQHKVAHQGDYKVPL